MPVRLAKKAVTPPAAASEQELLDPTLPKGRLSHSAVSLYLSCAYSYYLEYVEKQPSVATPPLLLGSAAHEALEFNNLHKQKTGDDGTPEALVEVFHESWKVQLRRSEHVDFDGEKPDDLRTQGANLVRHYRRYTAPMIRPPAQGGIEERFAVRTPGGTPVVGFIDVVNVAGPRPEVLDYKVVARAKSKADAALSPQLGLYAYVRRTPDVGFVSLCKTAAPKVERATVQRTEDSVQQALQSIDSVAAAIRKGVFPYTDPASWKCQMKYCGVWHACPQGGRRKAPAQSFFV
jgi:hypothetical protein